MVALIMIITLIVLIVCGSIILINPRVFFFGIHEKKTIRKTPQEESTYEITPITASFTEIN